MKKIIGKTINSHVKQFWCKKCKLSTNAIYKDDKGSIVSTPKNQRRIALIDDSGCILQEFNSIKEAAVALGINYSNIGNVLQGYQKRTKGFRFKYI